jgi:uncharacterized protein (DUF1800 family)
MNHTSAHPLSRRDFLRASGALAAWAALAACQPNPRRATPLPPTSDPAGTPVVTPAVGDEALVAHTLRRISFGPTPEMFARVRRIGLGAFIDEQLRPQQLDDSPVEAQLARFTTLAMTNLERLQLDRQGQPAQELIAATLLRQRHSQRQLYEMMVDFWSNHFNISITKGLCRALKTDDDLHVIRRHALDTFPALLRASAKSPAMLFYLDQATSSRDVPNENYARELMELHTLGVNGGYTEVDVREAARALTGWSIGRRRDAAPGSYLYRPAQHDDGAKTILGLAFPAGQGERDGEQLLELLAGHPATATFISRKLARRFVADQPPDSLVTKLAETFTQTGGDIPAVVLALLNSDEFKQSAGQKVRRPLEFFIAALRLTGAEITGQPRPLIEHLRLLGQIPFHWEPPNGYPDVAGYWMTTSGLLNRWNFGMLLAAGLINGVTVKLRDLTRDADSPADVVDVLSTRFIGERLPDDARDILIDFASAGDLGRNLSGIAGLILGSPHFQVR